VDEHKKLLDNIS